MTTEMWLEKLNRMASKQNRSHLMSRSRLSALDTCHKSRRSGRYTCSLKKEEVKIHIHAVEPCRLSILHNHSKGQIDNCVIGQPRQKAASVSHSRIPVVQPPDHFTSTENGNALIEQH